MLGKLDGEDEHRLFVIGILVDDGVASLERPLFVLEFEKRPLSRDDLHLLICLNREFHDAVCQHLAVDDFGLDAFHGFGTC